MRAWPAAISPSGAGRWLGHDGSAAAFPATICTPAATRCLPAGHAKTWCSRAVVGTGARPRKTTQAARRNFDAAWCWPGPIPQTKEPSNGGTGACIVADSWLPGDALRKSVFMEFINSINANDRKFRPVGPASLVLGGRPLVSMGAVNSATIPGVPSRGPAAGCDCLVRRDRRAKKELGGTGGM